MGNFNLAKQALRYANVSAGTDPQLAGMLTLTAALIAATENRNADGEAALAQAADLTEHTGEGNAHYMSFGPTNVVLWQMYGALEAGDHGLCAELAESLTPERIISPSRRADYWANYARALIRLR